MMAAMLSPLGHAVATAGSGEEALQRLQAEPYDLVISDVGMGAGMNGWELAAQIQQDYPGVPIVLATGWGAMIEPEEARAQGIAAVVAKPYRLADLQRAVSEATQHRARLVQSAGGPV
jgi:CheY-like chemotaxis protein